MRALLLVVFLIAACAPSRVQAPDERPESSATDAEIVPPDALELPGEVNHLGKAWVDPYAGFRDRDDPRVIAYLEAENDYVDARMAHTEDLQEALFASLLGRIKEDDTSAPYLDGGYLYFNRTFEGKDYPVWYRKAGEEGAEELLLDPNALAENYDYIATGVIQPSPDHKLLAYSLDTRGNERFRLVVRDLETGENLPDVVEETYYSLEWAADGKSFWYTRVDELNRPFEVYRHRLGTPASQDQLIYREEDERFYLSISKSLSEEYVFIDSSSAVTSEVRLLDTANPDAEPKLFAARRQGVEYIVAHQGDRFVILTNDAGARTFRLAETSRDETESIHWKPYLPARNEVTLEDVRAFANHLVWVERRDGIDRLMITGGEGPARQVEFPEEPYTIRFGMNVDFDRPFVRIRYSSMTRPTEIFDIPLDGGELVSVKQTEVPGYDPAKYATDRIWAESHDGTRVPISLMWRKDKRGDGPTRLLLHGYGAYGASYDPRFSSGRTVLADRGFVVGIAHVRGGGDLGRLWYEDGKLLDKPNTFHDFIACAEKLVDDGWTTPEQLAISGRSAGGLLMGAVVNMRPELFGAVIAGVPFVDMLNTMLDANLPLTVIEYEEWGDPNDKAFFEAMAGYSPYDNVHDAEFPHILATAGLNDPRVGYWEPTKWVAKLRDHQQGDSTILLKTQMGAGHGGPSGRYKNLREAAFEYAFLLEHLAP